jgi:hypothetical protein
MLATLVQKPFDRAGWIFEIQWDGYRIMAEVGKGHVRLYSRNGSPATSSSVAVIAAAARYIACDFLAYQGSDLHRSSSVRTIIIMFGLDEFLILACAPMVLGGLVGMLVGRKSRSRVRPLLTGIVGGAIGGWSVWLHDDSWKRMELYSQEIFGLLGWELVGAALLGLLFSWAVERLSK